MTSRDYIMYKAGQASMIKSASALGVKFKTQDVLGKGRKLLRQGIAASKDTHIAGKRIGRFIDSVLGGKAQIAELSANPRLTHLLQKAQGRLTGKTMTAKDWAAANRLATSIQRKIDAVEAGVGPARLKAMLGLGGAAAGVGGAGYGIARMRNSDRA